MILRGDCLTILKTMDAESVHCCVTSPPYWGLRDYGMRGQLGLEDTPDGYVRQMVTVFDEVKRVLKQEGTLWLVLGDCYSSGNSGLLRRDNKGGVWTSEKGEYMQPSSKANPSRRPHGMKSKDLLGIPWRVAFALQAAGWYLRSDIIWHKPNPMPESVTDRPTKAHEYVFLLAKSKEYFYDGDAVREPASESSGWAKQRALGCNTWKYNETKERIRQSGQGIDPSRGFGVPGFRNRRTVWTVATVPFKGAHFATFPPKLIEPCILAGCPEGGTVLDPFFGAGTTGLVAIQHGREFIGVEINPKYADMAEERLRRAPRKQLEACL